MKRKLLLLLSLVFVMATTLVCAVGCKQNSKPTHKHSYAATWSTDGTNHWHECECGDKIGLEAHKGGTATCTEKAECEVCRVKYGEVNANNHAGSEFNYVSNGNGTHKKTYECCGATAAESEACSGGTATCKEQATCEHCKAKYGNVSTDNHVSTEVKYVSKGNGKHDILYKCCDAVKEADVACSGGQATECGKKNVCKDCLTEYGEPLAHSWKTEYKSDGTQHWHECSRTGCTAISTKENCAGGTATCTEKATCTTCGNEYGTALGHNYATTWSTDGTNHWHECSRCHDKKDLAAHSGGTATCTEQATCTACDTKYGDKKADNHTATTYRYEANNNGTHKKIHTCCGAVENATEACSGGQATVCGKKNVCEHCNTEYGTALAHDLEHHAAKEATCTEKGWKAYDTCKRGCGYTTYEEVAPTGHSYKEHEKEAAATYFEKGRKTVYQCENCQNNFYLDGETYVEITSETDLVIPYKTIISETTAAARDTSSTDLINEFVDSKVKECDDTVTKFVNIAKDGTTVKAAYFARTTSWAEKEDSAQNCGFIEVRIPTDVTTIIGVTFEYRLVDRNTDKCTYLATNDKAYGMKSYIEYKHSDAYTNNSKDTFGDTAFVADGAWHKTNLYCAQDNMQNVLFKIYHLDGEFVITNLHLITSFAGDAVTTISAANDDLINNIVHLETAKDQSSNKVKIYDQTAPNYVATTGINGEKVTALYFTKAEAMDSSLDGKATNYGNSEFRIEVSGTISKLSFDYRLIDSNVEKCYTLAEGDKGYGMKSFLEYKHHCTYTNETKAQYGDTFFDADGQWHHVEFTCEMEEMKAILFKIYHLQGEFMVTNVHADPAQHAHNWSTEWTTDGTDHWHACTGDGCNAKKDVADHTGGTATCTEQAECEVCHVKYGATLAHTEVVDAAVEATCTATGKTEGKHCSVCNKVLVEQTVVPAKGHNYVETDVEIEATYFEKGQKAKYHCEACQNNFYLDGETYVEITSETDLVIPYKTIISETTAAARDTSSTDLINEFVDSKVKECDDTVTKFVNIAKDGTTVKAAYFARTTSWAEKEDSAQNCGFIEVRIPTDVTTIIGVTFEYRLVDRNTDKCTYLATNDKAYGMKSYIEYKHSDAYTNNSKDTFGDTAFVADGAWHKTNLYCAQDNMQNVLFKIYHLDGEFVITNLHLITSFAGDATATTIADDSTDLIKSIVHLDSSNMNKIKIYDQSEPNYVTTTGINGDTVTALYFTKIQGLTVADDYDEDADGKRTNKNNWGFSEFRITVSGKITKLSFDYRLVDSNTEICETVYASGVLNPSDKNMGMKSFLEYKSSTNGYNCRTLEKYGNTLFEADGQWHHIEFEYTEEGMKNILFKIYHLQGEFMVTNIQATMA